MKVDSIQNKAEFFYVQTTRQQEAWESVCINLYAAIADTRTTQVVHVFVCCII